MRLQSWESAHDGVEEESGKDLVAYGAEDINRGAQSPWTESVFGRYILHYREVESDGCGGKVEREL